MLAGNGGGRGLRMRAMRRATTADATAAAPAKARPLALGEIAVIDLPGRRASPRFKTSGALTLTGRARIVGIGFDGRVAMDSFADSGKIDLPPRLSSVAIMAGAWAVPVATSGLTGGWVSGALLAYLGQSLARCRGGYVIAEGASRARAGAKAGIGWIDAGDLTDQSMLVETRLDRGAACVAILLEGAVTQDDLSALALSFDGDERADAVPVLVPVDGATLIVMQMRQTQPDLPLTVRVGGQLPGQLDGVFAADLSADRLVSSFVNGTLNFDLSDEFVDPDGSAKPGITAVWKAPKSLQPADQPAGQPADHDEDG